MTPRTYAVRERGDQRNPHGSVLWMALIAFFAATANPALGQLVERTVIGQRVAMKETGRQPRLYVLSTDPAVLPPSPPEVREDLIGSALGAMIGVCDGNGSVAEHYLPYTGWTVNKKGVVRYAGKRDDAIRKIVIKTGQVLVVGRRPLLATGVPWHGIGIQLIFPRTVDCLSFPAEGASQDVVGKFTSKNGTRPSGCARSELCAPLVIGLGPPT